LTGIAAPHVSPEGGWQSYAAAYRRITPDLADRTFVLLGTSHYGAPERFGVTRKPYETPLGTASVNTALLDKLVARAPARWSRKIIATPSSTPSSFSVVSAIRDGQADSGAADPVRSFLR